MPLEIGQTFLNKYHIQAEIGRGSFGRVYLAEEIVTGPGSDQGTAPRPFIGTVSGSSPAF